MSRTEQGINEQQTAYLFVYGTLRTDLGEEGAFSRTLGRSSELIGGARIDGTLYNLSWFPGIKLNTGKTVVGQLFRLNDLSILEELDRYEGVPTLFNRKITKVFTDQDVIEAFVYEYQNNVNEQDEIPSGDWKKRI